MACQPHWECPVQGIPNPFLFMSLQPLHLLGVAEEFTH